MDVTNCTHSTHLRTRLYSAIPRTDGPVIYTGAFPVLTARPGRRSIYNSKKQPLQLCRGVRPSQRVSCSPIRLYCRIQRLHHCRRGKTLRMSVLCPSRQTRKNTSTAFLLRGNTPPTSVLHMILNNLMARNQKCWSFGEYRVLHCPCSQPPPGPEWYHMIGYDLWIKQN